MKPTQDTKTIPSATIIMVREAKSGLETFMVVRHHKIDFASGALVFPGGKIDEQDYEMDVHCEGIKNCLLYTSPSPRDQRGSRMPSSA